MVRLFRFCLALALLAFGSQALASFSPPPVYVTNGLSPTTNSSSEGGSCALMLAYKKSTGAVNPDLAWSTTVTSHVCYGVVNSSQYNWGPITSSGAACPANSTGTTTCTCNTGFDESGSPVNACVPHTNQCTGKAASVVNWTAGWQRTPSVGPSEQLVAANPIPGGSTTMCVGGCAVQIDVSDPCPGCKAQVSQTPNSQGLYRVSVEMMAKPNGSECTAGASDAPVTPDDSKDPPCPGYVGDINGVKGCYGTASNPVNAQAPPSVVSGASKAPGNPAAGPSSPGAATPASGAGGSAGGPAAAATGASGSGGTGTVTGSQNGSGRVASQSGTEQANCGAPGQAPCKIDESGTPKDAGTSFDSANGQLDDAKAKYDDIRDKTSGASDKGMFEQFRNVFLVPPIAACENIVLPDQVAGKTIDACTVVDGVRSVMAYIWALAGLFLCLRMIKRSF